MADCRAAGGAGAAEGALPAAVAAPQSGAISHHLKVLREAGLVNSERRGTWVYYWPRPDNLRPLAALLDTPERVRA